MSAPQAEVDASAGRSEAHRSNTSIVPIFSAGGAMFNAAGSVIKGQIAASAYPIVVFCVQAEELTPAQAAAKRKDRSGGFMEGLQMIMSLTKRW
jgi:hypothetical protein